MKEKLIISVDYGTTYSGMQKSATLSLYAHGVPSGVAFSTCRTPEVAVMGVSAFESLKMMMN
jgi:hypothetical protein